MNTVQEFLNECFVEGTTIKVPKEQVDNKLFLDAKKKLELIGGVWKGGKVWGFQYKADPTELLASIQAGHNRNLKQEFQFFATPEGLAKQMVIEAAGQQHHRWLEPSAGQGAIVDAIIQHFWPDETDISIIEMMETNRVILDRKYRDNGASVKFLHTPGNDFITYGTPSGDNTFFDRIVANPPFQKNQDILHVYKMWDVLKPGGRIVTLTSQHWVNGRENACIRFKEWLIDVEAFIEDIPRDTFKESGTSVPAVKLVIDKPR